MLKKKNIAMMMAAATVVTTAAPAFAAQVDTTKVDEAKLKSEVEKMLNTKYTNPQVDGLGTNGAEVKDMEYTNSVYSIQGKIGSTTTIVDTMDTLDKLIEDAKIKEEKLVLTVTDKGHTTVDGRIVDTIKTKNEYYGAKDATGIAVSPIAHVEDTTAPSVVDTLANLKVHVEKDTENQEVTLTLLNGTKIELAKGDFILNFNKPVDANGNVISTSGVISNDTARKIAGFEKVESAREEYKDIASKKVAELEFNANDVKEVSYDAADLYDADHGFTDDGEDFVNDAIDAKAGKDFVKNGVKYDVTLTKVDDVEIDENGGYKFEMTLSAFEKGETALKDNVTVIVKGNVEKDLKVIHDKIVADKKVTASYTKLAGDDRFETAVEISKEAYTADKSAGSIVLVGENAIVDGLAAAPLAAQKNAPILLTKKDTVPTKTMDEIKRLVEDDATIYLIGGENTISKEVEKELIKEKNANIVRLQGKDRYETSLEIADELDVATLGTTAYVVGGSGLADAMSVASFAANSTAQAPIIVTPKAGLTKDAKDFIEDTTKLTDVKVIGGESHVSTQVLKDAKDLDNIATTSRISGKDRNETNSKVVNALATDGSLKRVYAAKDGDAQLVDALAAAPLAGKTEGAIILATKDLTDDQEDTITAKSTAGTTKLTQIGNGIAKDVTKTIMDLLNIARTIK